MLRVVLLIGRFLARTLTNPGVFEAFGAAAIVAGVVLLAGWEWGLIGVGVCGLVKSFDLALAQGR